MRQINDNLHISTLQKSYVSKDIYFKGVKIIISYLTKRLSYAKNDLRINTPFNVNKSSQFIRIPNDAKYCTTTQKYGNCLPRFIPSN